MNPIHRLDAVRITVAAQLAAVMIVAWYWHVGWPLLPRAVEGPMEGVTMLSVLLMPLSGFVVLCLSPPRGWRLLGFLGVEAGLGIAVLIALLPTVQ